MTDSFCCCCRRLKQKQQLMDAEAGAAVVRWRQRLVMQLVSVDLRLTSVSVSVVSLLLSTLLSRGVTK